MVRPDNAGIQTGKQASRGTRDEAIATFEESVVCARKISRADTTTLRSRLAKEHQRIAQHDPADSTKQTWSAR